MRSAGLSGPRISLLSVLVFAGPLPIGKLAGIEQISGPAITKLVDGLARDGLAERIRSDDDRQGRPGRSHTRAGKKRLEEGRARRVRRWPRLSSNSIRKDQAKDLEAFEALSGLLAERLVASPAGDFPIYFPKVTFYLGKL